MTKFDLELNNVKSIVYDESAMDVYLTENGELVFNSNIKGNVIDANFNELDSRLSSVESQLRLRINGELQRLRTELEVMSNQVNMITARHQKLGEEIYE